MPVDVLDGDGRIVHQNAHRQREAPSVIRLSVSPESERPITAPRIASGIDTAMITVERHEPRKSRIIRLVSTAAIAPSLITPDTASFTNSDWSESRSTFRPSGRSA
jgi:hypothetical protein